MPRKDKSMFMEQDKKFISPGAWFAMRYPAAWSEFEDGEGSFLFYNPDVWDGNFRISAYRGEAGSDYGRESVRQELAGNREARRVELGGHECAYSREEFEEEGAAYVCHFWVVALGEVAAECSFTVPSGGEPAAAEAVIGSLEVRRAGERYPAEIIPVRLSKICQINEAYEWTSNSVKQLLKKDFQGVTEDIPHMQQLADSGQIGRKNREAWLALGITLCVIWANETDGWEWRTLIDGNREAPVLQHVQTGEVIDPMKLVWSKVKAGEKVVLADSI